MQILRLVGQTNRGCSIGGRDILNRAGLSNSLERVSELPIPSQQFGKLFGLYCLSYCVDLKTGANSLSLLSARHEMGE